jgi:hypothetical protein
VSELTPSAKATLSEVFTEKCTIPGYGETRGIVGFTDDFRRIEALPRVTYGLPLVDELTERYRTLNGTMRLRPLQALALEVLHDCRGLLGSLPVGSGKTLITLLAAMIVGADNPLLIVPAHLREKTDRDFEELQKHWAVAVPAIVTYQWLARASQSEWLDEFLPDFVCGDEAHRLRRSGSCTRRVFRYLRENPEVPFCALSGTLMGRSLLDFHKLSALTLGPENMPLPKEEPEAKLWARAVDEKVDIRAKPGALGMFLEPDEKPSLENIRKAVGRRVFQTPGVIAAFEDDVTASITIRKLSWPIPSECRDHAKLLLEESQAPNGDECTPADVYRHLRSLSLGFFYEWDPAPSHDWLDARRHWKRFAREILQAENPLYDSEFQVANAAKQGLLDPSQWHAWDQVRHTYAGESVAVWLSDDTIDRVVEHVGDSETIVWVEQIAVGDYLSERTGWPYYHKLGKDRDGNFIDEHGEGPMIASIASNSEGRNLQRWSRALVLTPPASGKIWEQMLGRMHRHGQTADEVHIDVILAHTRIRQQFRQAVRDAELIRDMTGQPQKMLIADIVR